MKKGKIFICKVCGNDFYRPRCQIFYRNLQNRYCSRICFGKAIRKGKDKRCLICKKQYHRPPSQIRLRGSRFCSVKCRGIYQGKKQKGKNNIQWKGGVSKESHRLRTSKKWKIWRQKVFTRDNFTCQLCGSKSQKGLHVTLHPHHLKSFADYSRLRFTIKNGLTLCSICHINVHKNR